MSTTRELLDLCAKALGIQIHWNSDADPVPRRVDDQSWRPWHPVNDDGDAFRMAIDLNIRYGLNLADGRGWVEFEDCHYYAEFEWNTDDPIARYAATRLALAQAGAEIGLKMTT